MTATHRHTLICTAGTSLFANLGRPATDDDHPGRTALVKANGRASWDEVAALLHRIDPNERLCGAEINSVSDLLANGMVAKGRLHLLVSDTSDGQNIGAVLEDYFRSDGWLAEVHCIDGLRDDEPRVFRTRGLRNLAKAIGRRVRESGADFCAINATGGYKAH